MTESEFKILLDKSSDIELISYLEKIHRELSSRYDNCGDEKKCQFSKT